MAAMTIEQFVAGVASVTRLPRIDVQRPLTPTDWRLAAQWFADEVPLAVIAEVAEEVSAAMVREHGTASSLVYLAAPVRRRWGEARRMRTLAARGPAQPIEIDVAAALRTLERQVLAAVGEDDELTSALAGLRAERWLRGDPWLVEDALRQAQAARAGALVEEHRLALLGRYGGRMRLFSQEGRERFLRRAAWGAAGLPRLTLFALGEGAYRG
jgi:hypothetical protein